MATTNFREKEREAAEKKTKMRKKARRKKQIIAAVVASVVVCLITLCVLSLTVFFKIETITVSGSTTYTAEEVISAAGIAVGDNLILASKKSINETLQKALPFIEEVKVQKQFPGQLRIEVKETNEDICFANNRGYYSANIKGKIIKKYSDLPKELILITVSNDVSFTEGEFVSFSAEREKELYDNFITLIDKDEYDINFINISDSFSAYAKIEGRIIAKFGASSYFENKAAYLKASLKSLSETTQGVLDLSAWTPENNRPYLAQGDISSYEK